MKSFFAASLVASLAVVVAAAGGAPIVETATVDSIIHPVSAEFMRSAIARADAEGAALIVFTLHTPGGLLDSTRDINNAIIGAKTPVAIFVGPAGYRAASAGFLITMAADVAAMAPGTHIGAAHPVSGDGQPVDAVMAKKMASDTAAYAQDPGRAARPQRAARRTGGHREPLVHRAGSDRGHPAADRRHRQRRPGPHPQARRPHDQTLQRHLDDAASSPTPTCGRLR